MKYFTLKEFTASDTAKKLRIDNSPSSSIVAHINEAVDNLFDPLRAAWEQYCKEHHLGKASIKVNSGYRCHQLNDAVGGVKTSGHLSGYAADLYPMNGQLKKFYNFSREWLAANRVQFDECLDEYGRWVHMSYKSIYGLQRKKIGRIG